jgi:predicted PurR-regulated permease PerM
MVLVLTGVILFYGKSFLIPFTIAGLLSMLLLPVTKWLRSKGIAKALAILIAMLSLVAVIVGVVWLIAWQVQDLAKESSGIEQQLTQKLKQVQDYISETFNISKEKQQEVVKEQQSSSQGGAGKTAGTLLSGLGSFLTNLLLVFVYIFLFIFFSNRIRQFIIKIAGTRQKANTEKALDNIQQVSQKYLTGLAMMIAILWIMYGIGFSIVGVKQALFFAVLCGLLEIVPFIGNLTGTALTILASVMQGGDMNMVIGILITYTLVQFIQTYLLEPLVVGAGVNINPLFTIIGLVAGELLWGIAGMMLAIPLMAIFKIVCEHVDALQPFALLMGSDDKEPGVVEKIKKAFKKKK